MLMKLKELKKLKGLNGFNGLIYAKKVKSVIRNPHSAITETPPSALPENLFFSVPAGVVSSI